MSILSSCPPRRARYFLGIPTAFLICLAVFPANPQLQRAADDPSPAAKLEIHKGDHICIIGNTLADRMQHDGWLETLFPRAVSRNCDLVIPQPRLLRRRADAPRCARPTSAARPVADLHTRPTWSSPSSATTSRSPAQAGLDKFKKDLDDFIKHTLSTEVQRQERPAPRPLLAHRP